MPFARFSRITLVSALAVALLPACSSDAHSAANSSYGDVQFEGDATVAELRAFFDKKPDDWAWAGGAFDTPEDGQVVPADASFEFTWRSDPIISEAGTNEAAYLLVFSSASQGTLAQVFTTRASYTPNAKTWQKLASASAAVSLSISGATFQDGTLLEDEGGPHNGQTLTFTVE